MIVPDITWIATAAPIAYVGATPVFAHIEPASWCISAESIEAGISDNTVAVIVVDLYSNMPARDEIMAVAERHDVAVIEDAAFPLVPCVYRDVTRPVLGMQCANRGSMYHGPVNGCRDLWMIGLTR